MQIKRYDIPRISLEDFADEHGLVMKIRERATTRPERRYYASFEDVEIKDGVCLIFPSGDGETPEAAMSAYAAEISNKHLVVNAYQTNRRDIWAPIILSSNS